MSHLFILIEVQQILIYITTYVLSSREMASVDAQ